MPKITVQTKQNRGFARKQLQLIKRLADSDVKKMADLTAEAMKNSIQASITRANSTGKLENGMFVTKLANGYGVGDIDYLNANVPYWRHVNYGSTAIGASHGHRVPTGGFSPGTANPQSGGSGSRWSVGSGEFSFAAKKPIAPLNYIQKTLRQVPSIINTVTGT